MHRILIVFAVFFLLTPGHAGAQTWMYQGKNVFHADTLSLDSLRAAFVVLGDTSIRKPLIVFCTGSSIAPVFIQKNGKTYALNNPIPFNDLLQQYHFLFVGKTGLPMVDVESNLDDQQSYSGTGFDLSAFWKYNTLENNTLLAHSVLKKLLKAPWIDQNKVVLLGHSQGSRVATKTAVSTPGVTHLVYLSCSPVGRFFEMIRRERIRAGATPEEKQAKVDNLLALWKDISDHPGALDKTWGDPYPTWTSFSENLIDDLLRLEIPVFLGFGTEDVACELCDLIPYEFIRAGKTNLTTQVYPGVEHNFYPLGPDKKPDYTAGKWDQVMRDIFSWIGTH